MPFIKSNINADDVIKMYKSGKTTKEIANFFGVGARKITEIASSVGYTPTPIQNSVDIGLVVSLYKSGVSQNAIAKQLGVSRSVIRNRLCKAGVIIRGPAEANQLMMSKRTPEENARNSRAAHDAVRNKPKTHQQLCNHALGVQNAFTSFKSPYEQDIADELINRGIKFVPQLAVDKYNINFAIGNNIALEVFGGNWHAKGRHRARFAERSKKLFDSGYAIVICWIGFNHRFNPSAIVDYLISLDKVLCSDPSARRKHYVIGGHGKPCSIGKSKLNYIS